MSRLLAEYRARRSRPHYFDSPLRRILFVCYGNICRSPFAELYWNARRAAFEERGDSGEGARPDRPVATSAGIYPVVGRATPDRIAEVTHRLGVDLRGQRSRPLDAAAVHGADAIFVMDLINYRDVLARYPDARSKTWLLGLFAEADFGVIDDPYLMSAEEAAACYEKLIRALDGLFDHARPDHSAETMPPPIYVESDAHM